MNISGVMVSIGAMAVIAGLTIMWNDPTHHTLGGIIALLGLALSIGAYFRVVSEDNKKLEQERNELNLQQEIASGIKDMNKNINELTTEIRRDREEHKEK